MHIIHLSNEGSEITEHRIRIVPGAPTVVSARFADTRAGATTVETNRSSPPLPCMIQKPSGRTSSRRIFVTSSSQAKLDRALEMGADHAINYRTHDFVAEVKGLTEGQGADVILDMVAGEYTQRNLDCLAEDGRLVTIAVLGGAQATVNMAGLPAISLPCGFHEGLPIGLQIQAPPFEEERCLRAAHMFQQATDWHTKRPKLG